MPWRVAPSLRAGWCFIIFGLLGSGCAEVSAAISGEDFAKRVYAAQEEAKVLRPGEVGLFLDTHTDERMRTVVYRLLAEQRQRIRAGSSAWTPLDLVALTEQSKRDVLSKNKALSKVARQQYVWSLLEGISPGELSTLINGPFTAEVVEWIIDWNRPGRPNIEGRLNRADHEAVQAWATQRLPTSRYLLRWSLEQDQRPGQIAGFLSRSWTDQQLVEILRMWCTSEGWSPLAHADKLLTTDKSAVQASLTRLDRSKDPLVRREAAKWRQWLQQTKSRSRSGKRSRTVRR